MKAPRRLLALIREFIEMASSIMGLKIDTNYAQISNSNLFYYILSETHLQHPRGLLDELQ
jgi:hypothetical protein